MAGTPIDILIIHLLPSFCKLRFVCLILSFSLCLNKIAKFQVKYLHALDVIQQILSKIFA